jgi:hypothetical protein
MEILEKYIKGHIWYVFLKVFHSQTKKGTNMVLFYCGHSVSLSQIVSLRYHFHADDRAILLSTDSKFVNSNFASKLIEIDCFMKIIFVHMRFTFHIETLTDQENKIVEYFDRIYLENYLEEVKFTHIYTAIDISNEFGIYLSLKHLPFIMCEPAPNHFKSDVGNSHDEKHFGANPSLTQVNTKYDVLRGVDNHYVIRRLLYNTEGTLRGDLLSKDYLVDFWDLLVNLPLKVKNAISSCLDKNLQYLTSECSCLFLTQSPRACMDLSGLSKTKMNLPYQLIADYYGSKWKIYIKEHPEAESEYFLQKYLEDSIQIDPAIPVDFYNFRESFAIRRVLSPFSSGTKKISNLTKEIIDIGNIFGNYTLCHRLFFAFSLANEICTFKTQYYYSESFDGDFLIRFVRLCFNDFGAFPNYVVRGDILKGDSFVILYKIDPGFMGNVIKALVESDLDTKVIFLDTNEQLNMLNSLIPIQITKTPTNDKCLDNLEPEVLYFFCKNSEVRMRVENFSMEKTLKHTKLLLHAAVYKNSATVNIVEKPRQYQNYLSLSQKLLQEYQKRVTELENSKSWKITALLRAIKNFLKRIKTF